MFSLDAYGYNLGLCIFSWGLGAEMMYSSNFGFWSSVSFFSPDDFTSGFTGSGGFSLLWGPFVQPLRVNGRKKKNQWRKLIKITSAHMANIVDGDAFDINRKWRQGNWELTTMLRKSEKSVVLRLQQDHPYKRWDVFNFSHIFCHQILATIIILPSMHHEIQGLPGERCSHLGKKYKEMGII